MVLALTVFRERWQNNLNAEGRYYDKTAEACAKVQAGDIADMDLVAKKLPETFKA